jgi:chromosome segregation ATPase
LKLRAAHEDAIDKMDGLKKENRAMQSEISSLNESLSEGGKSSHEVEKLRRKLELEKEELTSSLEEAEMALEQEEAKSLKVQLELTQLKQGSDRKMAEKDEEIENMRKNHSRQLESLQAMVDNESRSKAELAKMRKKIEGDMGDRS